MDPIQRDYERAVSEAQKWASKGLHAEVVPIIASVAGMPQTVGYDCLIDVSEPAGEPYTIRYEPWVNATPTTDRPSRFQVYRTER